MVMERNPIPAPHIDPVRERAATAMALGLGLVSTRAENYGAVVATIPCPGEVVFAEPGVTLLAVADSRPPPLPPFEHTWQDPMADDYDPLRVLRQCPHMHRPSAPPQRRWVTNSTGPG